MKTREELIAMARSSTAEALIANTELLCDIRAELRGEDAEVPVAEQSTEQPEAEDPDAGYVDMTDHDNAPGNNLFGFGGNSGKTGNKRGLFGF